MVKAEIMMVSTHIHLVFGYDKDEVFQYDETTRKIIADLWSRVKVSASNAH